MVNDIIPPTPPRRPTQRPMEPAAQQRELAPQPQEHTPDPTPLPDVSLQHEATPEKKRNWLKIIAVTVLALIVATALGSYAWYQSQLAAVSSDQNVRHVRINVEEGSGPALIAEQLEDSKVIRSAFAFRIYAKLQGMEDKLQAGTYNLSPASTTQQIVENLTSGKVDTINVTFLPGATVADNKKVLLELGYRKSDIDAAFDKSYDHPALASKPASADLEGYIYGETYNFASSASVEDILTRTFDELYTVVKDNDLVAKYKKQGLSLYEGITLASIIQREVITESDMRQVAQVFFLRLKTDEPLGSDVTYQYIADKTGVPRDPGLNSPYNTRVVKGLPPGPIAAPGKTALLSVASPAKGDYVFFLSGDDDKTYFARTQAEHEANIRNHCQQKCQIL